MRSSATLRALITEMEAALATEQLVQRDLEEREEGGRAGWCLHNGKAIATQHWLERLKATESLIVAEARR